METDALKAPLYKRFLANFYGWFLTALLGGGFCVFNMCGVFDAERLLPEHSLSRIGTTITQYLWVAVFYGWFFATAYLSSEWSNELKNRSD